MSKPFIHRARAGAASDIKSDLDEHIEKLENQPVLLQGRAEGLGAAAARIREHHLKELREMFDRQELPDTVWNFAHRLVRGIAGELEIMSKDAERAQWMSMGQLKGFKNSAKIASGHVERHEQDEAVENNPEVPSAFSSSSDPKDLSLAVESLMENTAKQLREDLDRRGLPTNGNKPQLAQRLAEALLTETPS